MAPMASITLPGVGEVTFENFAQKWGDFLKQQPPTVEVVVTGLQASIQGGALGYVFGMISSMDPGAGGPQAASPAFAQLSKAGPWGSARNIATLTGVQAAASLAIKKARQGKDDVYSAMGASFISGVAYSLVSGAPNPIQGAISTGAAFAVFNGIVYQVTHAFKPEFEDTEYDRGKYMLKMLGLTKYAENLKKGLLTDNTIMLWNESALSEVRIPPGPRLLILHHVDMYRNPGNVLKPALPLPPLPPPPPPAPAAAANYAAAGARAPGK